MTGNEVPRALHVHLGPCDAEVAGEIRRRTPPVALLLYVHPDGELHDSVGIVFARVGGDAIGRLGSLLEEMGLDDGSSVWTSSSCGLDNSYGDALSALRSFTIERMSAIRCARAGRMLFLRASIRNIPSIALNGSWRPLMRFPKCGALICGAGPSLKRLAPRIRNLQGVFAVFAVGRALETLRDAGVEPDAVCEIDPLSHLNWEDAFKAPDCPLIAPAIVSPGVASRFSRVLWTKEPGGLDVELEFLGGAIPQVELSRSVSEYALECVVRLFGFGKIAFAGLDLCLAEDGASHAGQVGSVCDDGDEGSLTSVPGREGGSRTSNTLFDGMRESLEARLRNMPDGTAVFNCSEGGAAICGAVAASVESFAESLEPFPCKGVFVNAVESFPSDMGKVLESLDAMKHEGSLASGVAARHAADLLRESSGTMSEDGFKTLKEGLIGEVAGDCEYGISVLRKCETSIGRLADEHCMFERSLKAYAVGVVGKWHREFGEMLDAGIPLEGERRWEIRANHMRLPFVRLKRGDGSWFRLSARLSMDGVAAAELDGMLLESRFDESNCAAVLVCPGNWMHALEFARHHPNARLLVVEPWADLFHHLICRSQFMHRLPSGTMIVGADERLSGWRDLLFRRVRRLQSEGFKPVMLRHPRTWLLPEVEALAGELSSAWKIQV